MYVITLDYVRCFLKICLAYTHNCAVYIHTICPKVCGHPLIWGCVSWLGLVPSEG
uniref:Uncharacterized protein n=1 Tax=Anguilla anguilla TaxID=7936 RepID=A0A0E9V623_ANGAN